MKFLVSWVLNLFKKPELEVQAEPWPFPVVIGTPPAKKKPTVKKASTRIVKDRVIKEMKEPKVAAKKVVKNETAKRANTRKKKVSK